MMYLSIRSRRQPKTSVPSLRNSRSASRTRGASPTFRRQIGVSQVFDLAMRAVIRGAPGKLDRADLAATARAPATHLALGQEKRARQSARGQLGTSAALGCRFQDALDLPK